MLKMGHMYYWRLKSPTPKAWKFGFASNAGSGLVRMGRWNGDRNGGHVVRKADIEYRPYA